MNSVTWALSLGLMLGGAATSQAIDPLYRYHQKKEYPYMTSVGPSKTVNSTGYAIKTTDRGNGNIEYTFYENGQPFDIRSRVTKGTVALDTVQIFSDGSIGGFTSYNSDDGSHPWVTDIFRIQGTSYTTAPASSGYGGFGYNSYLYSYDSIGSGAIVREFDSYLGDDLVFEVWKDNQLIKQWTAPYWIGYLKNFSYSAAGVIGVDEFIFEDYFRSSEFDVNSGETEDISDLFGSGERFSHGQITDSGKRVLRRSLDRYRTSEVIWDGTNFSYLPGLRPEEVYSVGGTSVCEYGLPYATITWTQGTAYQQYVRYQGAWIPVLSTIEPNLFKDISFAREPYKNGIIPSWGVTIHSKYEEGYLEPLVAVPEPSSLAIYSIGALVLSKCRKKPKHQ